MLTNGQVRWLIFEGLIPLFGASILYCAWGLMKYLTATPTPTSPFSFAWRECVDALGWLSGILIIAIQAAIKSWHTPDGEELSYWCMAGAGACLLLLLSAMNERGQNPAWQPPLSTKVSSFLLVLALLGAACRAQVESKEVMTTGKSATTAAAPDQASTFKTEGKK